MQFSLISLIPGLIRKLQDCADPDLNSYEQILVKPTSLKTSDRNSLLCYMGLPLQIFGKVSSLKPQIYPDTDLWKLRVAFLALTPLYNNLTF